MVDGRHLKNPSTRNMCEFLVSPLSKFSRSGWANNKLNNALQLFFIIGCDVQRNQVTVGVRVHCGGGSPQSFHVLMSLLKLSSHDPLNPIPVINSVTVNVKIG